MDDNIRQILSDMKEELGLFDALFQAVEEFIIGDKDLSALEEVYEDISLTSRSESLTEALETVSDAPKTAS